MDEPLPEEEPAALPDHDFDNLLGVFADGVVGAISGFVGMALLTGTLLVAERLGGFDGSSFALLAELARLDAVGPPVLVGYVIFLGHGVVTFPLLFASLKHYLPGHGSDPQRGLVFGTALWTGFVPAFYTDYTGTALAAFLALSLVGHWAYGASMGLVFDYLTDRPDAIV